MKRTRRLMLLVLSFVMLFVLSACTKKDNMAENKTEETKVEESVKSEEGKLITIASQRDVGRGNEDAYWTNVNLYVWEPLIGLDDKGELIPVLATKWEMSEDAKEWTFNLREGVKFSDGTDFNADAVVKNFDRYKKVSPISSTFFTLDIEKTYPGLAEVTKVSDLSFALKFKDPMPMLPYTMLNWGSPMISPGCFDELTGMFTAPVVGTGQFVITEHKPDEYTDFTRNDNYWGEKAKAEKVRVRMIPDHDTRVAALRSGEIQGVYDNKAIQPLAAKELEASGKFDVSSTLSANIHYLQVNNAKEPFNDVRMRQAISLAVDRNTLLKDIYGGYGKVSSNLLSPLNQFYIDTPVEFNVEKAKSLANEVLKGKRVPVTLMTMPQYQTDCELIAAWLTEIGLDVKLEVLEYDAQKEKRQAGQYDIVMGFRGMDNADPGTMLKSFLTKDGYDNSNYNMGYFNEDAEKMVAEMDKTFDMEKRKEMFEKLQVFGAEQLPIIPLFGIDTTVASSKDITGYDAKWTGVSIYNTQWAEK